MKFGTLLIQHSDSFDQHMDKMQTSAPFPPMKIPAVLYTPQLMISPQRNKGNFVSNRRMASSKFLIISNLFINFLIASQIEVS